MKIIFSWISVLLISFAISLNAQENKLLFKNGDRVSFIGNSITHGGEFHSDIFLYYATRFPKEKVAFINCGISGDVASEIITRLNSDIMIHKPTVGVLMVGMNDMARGYSGNVKDGIHGIDKKETDAINEYKKNTTKIADYLTQHNCRLIIQLPSIYDQTAVLSTQNMFGVNDLLGICADYLRSFAQKYNAVIVDYWTIMNNINEREQKKDKTFTIVSKDRVHPGSPGNLVMAYQFLKSTGAPQYVSKIVIDSKSNKIVESINCKIKFKSSEKGNLKFESLEYALPCPVKPEAAPALDLVPFTEELNQEFLIVNNLGTGQYNLLIDGKNIGTYHSSDLEKGINLSMNPLTPQYVQALEVLKFCDDYRGVFSKLRTIAVVEYRSLQDYDGPDQMESKKAFLNNKLEKIKGQAYYDYVKNQCDQYYSIKPQQQNLIIRLDQIRDKIYQVNAPQKHIFEFLFIN